MKRRRRQLRPLPVATAKCGTCPFREGSPYVDLAPLLVDACMTMSRQCHSTGSNAINRRTGKSPIICRGTRDIQLGIMHRAGVIDAPTDEAWARAVDNINDRDA